MARKDRYYGTYAMIYGDMYSKIRELGYKGSCNQFRVVCKAKSRAEANRIAENFGLGRKVFQADYTSETGNAKEVELAEKYGFIINIDGIIGYDYIDIRNLLK